MNVTFILIIAAAAFVVLAALYLIIRQIGLQEADDPSESQPNELTRFEKEHVVRDDVRTES